MRCYHSWMLPGTVALLTWLSSSAEAVNMIEVVVASEDFSGPPTTKTFPAGWNVTWPQQWNVDRYGGANDPLLDIIADPTNASNPVGRINQHNVVRTYVDNTLARDVTVQTDIRWLQAQTTVTNQAGVMSRYTPDDPDTPGNETTLYEAIMIPNGQRLVLSRTIGSVTTTLATAIDPDTLTTSVWSISPVNWYTLKFKTTQVTPAETLLEAKLWLRGDPEPEDWLVSYTDNAPVMQDLSGYVGIDQRTSGNRRWAYDNFQASIFIVPEPSSLWLVGGLGILLLRRKRARV